MPYISRKVRGKNCYRVTKKISKNTRKNNKSRTVFSKCTTKENAKKQLNLLRALQYNKNFVYRSPK